MPLRPLNHTNPKPESKPPFENALERPKNAREMSSFVRKRAHPVQRVPTLFTHSPIWSALPCLVFRLIWRLIQISHLVFSSLAINFSVNWLPSVVQTSVNVGLPVSHHFTKHVVGVNKHAFTKFLMTLRVGLLRTKYYINTHTSFIRHITHKRDDSKVRTYISSRESDNNLVGFVKLNQFGLILRLCHLRQP